MLRLMPQVRNTHKKTRTNAPSFVLHVALAINLTGCSQPLAPSECEKLLLRYVDHLAASDRPDSTALERVRFKQKAREKAAHDPSFRQCPKKVSHAQFECAMNAANTDEFERCLL